MTRSARLGLSAILLAAVVLVPSALAHPLSFKPSSIKCPAVSIVNATLGQKNKAPTSTVTVFSKTCAYKGTGIAETKITFQEDTSATFAAAEKAVARLGIVKIKGLGQAAWAPKAGGYLYVLKGGGESIKILSLLTSTAKLEALARKLL